MRVAVGPVGLHVEKRARTDRCGLRVRHAFWNRAPKPSGTLKKKTASRLSSLSFERERERVGVQQAPPRPDRVSEWDDRRVFCGTHTLCSRVRDPAVNRKRAPEMCGLSAHCTGTHSSASSASFFSSVAVPALPSFGYVRRARRLDRQSVWVSVGRGPAGPGARLRLDFEQRARVSPRPSFIDTSRRVLKKNGASLDGGGSTVDASANALSLGNRRSPETERQSVCAQTLEPRAVRGERARDACAPRPRHETLPRLPSRDS